MRSTTFFTTVLATITASIALSSAANDTAHGQYVLTDDLSYDSFFSAFDFFDGPDPTQGFVQFQNMTSAVSQGLVGYLADTQSVFLGADYTNKDPKGRASVRLESKKSWNQGLLIADIRHMPFSTCGSWPAFWLLGSGSWPIGGEIDVIEGVNDYDTNSVTLHTSQGCVVDNSTSPASGAGAADASDAAFSGSLATADCNVAAPNQAKNAGCSIHAPRTAPGGQPGSASDTSSEATLLPSYGSDFNKANGGIYAMEWTSSSISVWFFPRDSPGFAANFGGMANNSTNATASPDPSKFGTPMAHFAGSGCDFPARFKDLKIIFDTTFCGQWAGASSEWDKSCAKTTGVSTCEAYVRDNPDAFRDAYWEVAGLKWFQRETETQAKRATNAPVPKRDAGASLVKAKGRHFRW